MECTYDELIKCRYNNNNVKFTNVVPTLIVRIQFTLRVLSIACSNKVTRPVEAGRSRKV